MAAIDSFASVITIVPGTGTMFEGTLNVTSLTESPTNVPPSKVCNNN